MAIGNMMRGGAKMIKAPKAVAKPSSGTRGVMSKKMVPVKSASASGAGAMARARAVPKAAPLAGRNRTGPTGKKNPNRKSPQERHAALKAKGDKMRASMPGVPKLRKPKTWTPRTSTVLADRKRRR